MTYLVRKIQQDEETAWVDQLSVDPACYLPVPVVPRRPFQQVAVLHRGRILEFDLDRIQPASGHVPVGAYSQVLIDARVLIYVKPGPLRIGSPLIRGFQGIRYAQRWSRSPRRGHRRRTRACTRRSPVPRPAGETPAVRRTDCLIRVGICRMEKSRSCYATSLTVAFSVQCPDVRHTEPRLLLLTLQIKRRADFYLI